MVYVANNGKNNGGHLVTGPVTAKPVQNNDKTTKKPPLDAITLYREVAEVAISGRQSKTYQQAALHLRRVKALYGGLQDRAKWEECIAGFRRDYAHLPALQDELKKVGL